MYPYIQHAEMETPMLQRSKTLVEKDCINGHRCVAAKDGNG